MSGLNAIEMSSFALGQGGYDYERASERPDRNEPARARSTQGFAWRSARTIHPGQGGAVAQPQRAASAALATALARARRCRPGASVARTAVQPAVRWQASQTRI